MAGYNRKGWLDTVMDQVRCKPERKAIRAELLGHMEEKEQFFLDSGMGPGEAARACVEAMGDPVEVGKELDRAHPFVWGKLYTVLKVVIILLCFVVLFCIVDDTVHYDPDGLLQRYPVMIVQTNPYEVGGEDAVILDVEREPVTLSGYTFEVTQAYWSPNVYSGEENVLEVDIKVSNPRPWAVTPLFIKRMQVNADEGITKKLCVAASNGDRILGIDVTFGGVGEVERGYVMDQWHDDLKDFRYWGSWYFTYVFQGVEPGDTIVLNHPDHEELTMTFTVEVEQ